jgi:hypothetical protein
MRGYMAGAIPLEVFEEMQRGLPAAMLLKIWPFFLFAKEQANFQAVADHEEARQQRRAERAQRKAERRRRREQARQQATSPPPEPDAPPSPNGHFPETGVATADQAPSTNGDFGAMMATLAHWLRSRRLPPGDTPQS